MNDSPGQISEVGAAESTESNPPRAPLVLCVGAVGHCPDPKKRPNPDVRALRKISRKLLVLIQDTFAGVAIAHGDLFASLPVSGNGKPQGLRLISALAEGADQWVTTEAVDLGYELQVVLPFGAKEYEKDFNADVLEEHRRLRNAAPPFSNSMARESERETLTSLLAVCC
jgi:hypothetical protein